MSYNDHEVITINSLEDGVCFKTSDGREFKKIKKIRKNYKCIELKSDKIYRFSPFRDISFVNNFYIFSFLMKKKEKFSLFHSIKRRIYFFVIRILRFFTYLIKHINHHNFYLF